MSPGEFGPQSALASCVSLCSRRQFHSEWVYWTGRVRFSRDRESQPRSCGTTCLQEGSGCPYPGPLWWQKERSSVLCKDRILETPIRPTRAYGWKADYRWGASNVRARHQVRRAGMPPPSLGTLLCLPRSLGYRLAKMPERNVSICYHSSLGWEKLRGSWKNLQGTCAPTDKKMDSVAMWGGSWREKSFCNKALHPAPPRIRALVEKEAGVPVSGKRAAHLPSAERAASSGTGVRSLSESLRLVGPKGTSLLCGCKWLLPPFPQGSHLVEGFFSRSCCLVPASQLLNVGRESFRLSSSLPG